MAEENITFYGKQFTLRSAPMALRADEDPPLVVSMLSWIIPCPLGGFDEHSGKMRICSRGLQMPLDLAPSVFMCPHCLGLMFIDDSLNAGKYQDADLAIQAGPRLSSCGADLQWSPMRSWSLFGYKTHPLFNDQRGLHTRIRRSTSGGAILVAGPLSPESEQMFGTAEGRYTVIPMAYTQAELNSYLPKPSVVADFVCRAANLAYHGGCYGETIGVAQRALVVEPDCVEALFLVGMASDELGLFDAAISAYQAALHIRPGFAEAHNNLGLVYWKKGCTDEAIREYRAALRINPNCAEAHHSIGQIFLQKGYWNEAIGEYQAALRIKPGYAEAHHNLGVAYYQQGRLDSAIREFQAALRISPDDGEAHCNLGMIYWEQRQVDGAIREWQIAARLGFEPARERLAQVGLS